MESFRQEISKGEKPNMREGVNFVFEQNPDFLTIGTKEQYSEYLNTVFPESKIQDFVYHQTDGDWYKDGMFNYEKIGKTDIGYYGEGFYFSTKEGFAGSYGQNMFLSKLDIKNPKYNIDTHAIGKQILSKQSKEESKEVALDWLKKEISYYKNEVLALKAGQIRKHMDIPPGVVFEEYWESERIARINNIQKILENYEKQTTSIDTIVDEYYSYDGFFTSDDLSGYEEILVRNPEQVHILGSKQDSERFKTFVSKQ